MSTAGQMVAAASAASMGAAASAGGLSSNDEGSASVVARDLLIETIRKNVMAWTKWTMLDAAGSKFKRPGRTL